MLKTGVKDGPNKGRSFYVCVDKQGCDFSQLTSVPPSSCLQHEDSVVELQALTFSQQQQGYRLFYRCNVGKKAGQRWCGNVPWTLDKEKRNPLSDKQLQPACPPPVRNPFRVPSKADKESEWRKMQCGERHEKGEEKDSHASHDGEEKECDRKGDVESKSAEQQKEKLDPSDTYRGKELPAGMTIKKRVSEEEDRPKADGEMTKENLSEGRKVEKSRSSSSVHADKTSNNCCEEQRERDSGGKRSVKSASSQDPPQAPDQHHKPTNSHSQPAATRDTSAPTSTNTPAGECINVDDDDDVQLVSLKSAAQKTPPFSAVQKPITSCPGFQVKGQQGDPKHLHSLLAAQLKQKKATLSVVNVAALPDKGERLRTQVKELEEALDSLSLSAVFLPEAQGDSARSQVNPFSRQGGTILLPDPPAPRPLQVQTSSSSLGLQLSQGSTQMYGANPQVQAFYGGRMTDDRLLAVKNATSEAIDHLHRSLESCPGPDTEAPDPKGIKVSLLDHQRKALVWLLWRETQNPCGGILADDMGLGKTLTMISLILAKKEEEEDKTLESWVSKNDSGPVTSKGTLIVCPASLLHHWKNEIHRHVKRGQLTVCLYHGPNRQKNARVLAGHDVVVTTYGLVSKEIPVQKEEAENPRQGAEDVPVGSAPLLRVAWARLILDEAHNIKNPKVQTSMAACRLRAGARWAVTGTPIQNNLLDMYSLLRFLRCSPFDEYKLWKAQVDNGSSRGRERLNILTKSLLLRRTKHQRDSTGKPLVSLPDRTCELHQVKLCEDEQAVYDVVFAQSRSTLQNYLRRHEGNDVSKGNTSASNPFDKVAQEFGLSQSEAAVPSSQQVSSTVHILSLLLRLRQCCCHLSLLKK
ncbi:hypothetical protein LDENG_00215460, partial [Lucifuga dentata]